MPVSGGGFEQAYNAQAAVDVDSMLVVAQLVTQAPNDKEQVVPMLKQIAHLPESEEFALIKRQIGQKRWFL
jgi:hypothetical protein